MSNDPIRFNDFVKGLTQDTNVAEADVFPVVDITDTSNTKKMSVGTLRDYILSFVDAPPETTPEETTEIYCFSTRKIYGTATRCGAIRRADGTSTDLGFDSNGMANTAAMVSFLAGQTGYWSIWENQAGGVDFFQPNAPLDTNQPIFTPFSVGGRPALTCDGTRYMYDSNAVLADTETNLSMVIACTPSDNTGSRCLFTTNDLATGTNKLEVVWRADNGQIGYILNGGYTYSGISIPASSLVLGFSFSEANGTTINVNGMTIVTGLPYTKIKLGDAIRIGTSATGTPAGFRGAIHTVRVFTGAMTAETLAQYCAKEVAYLGLDSQPYYPIKASPSATDLFQGIDVTTGQAFQAPINSLSFATTYNNDAVLNPARSFAGFTAAADGSTNDYTLINNAINAAKTANGGKLTFQPGEYAIGTQITQTALANILFSGEGKAVLKKINTPARILDFGLTDFPASSTVPQVQNVASDGMAFKGLGNPAVNPANNLTYPVNNNGNMFALKKALNFQMRNFVAEDIDNAFLRFSCVGEGALFDDTGYIPVRIDDSNFKVAGQDVTSAFSVGGIIGLSNGTSTNINNVVTVGLVSAMSYDGTDTLFTLNYAADASVGADYLGVATSKAVVSSGTMTTMGRLRTTRAFEGFGIIQNGYLRNVKQACTTNDTGTRHLSFRDLFLDQCGEVAKLTCKVLGNKYHILDGIFARACGERLLVQSSEGTFIRNYVSFGGVHSTASAYGALTIFFNNEDILRHDNNNYLMDGGMFDGDYQCVYVIGRNTEVIRNVKLSNLFFNNVTATRGGAYGLITGNGRLQNFTIKGVVMMGTGSTVDAITITPYCTSGDTYSENILIDDVYIDGSKLCINIAAASGSTRKVRGVTIRNATVRNAKGIKIDAQDVRFENCDLDFLPYDGTTGMTYTLVNCTVNGVKINWQAGGVSAAYAFPLGTGSDSVKLFDLTIRATDANYSGIGATSSSVTNIDIVRPDVVVGNDAVVLTGSGFTGSLQGGKITGGGSGTLYDLITSSSISDLVLSTKFGTGNNSINYTNISNVKKITWNPPSIASGASTTTTITWAGLVFGDALTVGAPYDLQGLIPAAYVQSAGGAILALANLTGGAIDLASSTDWYLYKTAKQ